MANVGSLNWLVKMEKAARAQSEAEELTEDFEQMGDKAQQADNAVEDLNDSTEASGGKMQSFSQQLGLTNGMLGLFTSGLVFAAQALLRLLGISIGGGVLGSLMTFIKGLSLASLAGAAKGAAAALKGYLWAAVLKLAYGAGVVVGYLEAFVGWLAAGSAGALALAGAIGAAIGLFVVWILHITGVLDWIGKLGEMVGNALPGWVRDGLLAVISIFAGALAVLGALIIGFIEGGFQGAWNRAKEVVNIFVGAWIRLFKRAKNLVLGFLLRIKNFFVGILQAGINAAKGIANWFDSKVQQIFDAFNGLKNDIVGFFGDVRDGIVEKFENVKSTVEGLLSDMGDAISGSVRTAFNAVVPDEISLPSTTLSAPDWAGGYSYTIGGQSLDLPQLQQGGLVEGTGIAEVHAGEIVGEPGALLEAAGQTATEKKQEVKQLIIENQTIEIGDQSIDISELGRNEIQELADAISQEQKTTFQQSTF